LENFLDDEKWKILNEKLSEMENRSSCSCRLRLPSAPDEI
jgi:hypothetical protein